MAKGSGRDERLLGVQIAEQLRQGILRGDWKPGSRIQQDRLAEQFGTSRIPVREALRLLENEGLVVLVPNSSAWISKLDKAECIEVYMMRERLEPLALAQSVAHLSDQDIAELSALATRARETPDLEDYIQFDREFHLLSVRRAPMPRLLTMVERFWNITQPYRRSYLASTGAEGRWISDAEHTLMIEAIKRRDAEEAGRMLGAHIRRTRLHLEQTTWAAG